MGVAVIVERAEHEKVTAPVNAAKCQSLSKLELLMAMTGSTGLQGMSVGSDGWTPRMAFQRAGHGHLITSRVNILVIYFTATGPIPEGSVYCPQEGLCDQVGPLLKDHRVHPG